MTVRREGLRVKGWDGVMADWVAMAMAGSHFRGAAAAECSGQGSCSHLLGVADRPDRSCDISDRDHFSLLPRDGSAGVKLQLCLYLLLLILE